MHSIYPQKGRLETIDVEFTDDNTTRFYSRRSGSVTSITDWDGDLLIKTGFDYPMYIYDVSRADIGFSKKNAEQLKRQYL